MKKKDFTPIALLFCLLAGIIVVALIRPGRVLTIWTSHSVNFDLVFIFLYIAWMLVESCVSKKDLETEGKKTSDRATCQIYGIGQALTFLTALWFQPWWREAGIVHFLGMGLFIAGVAWRLWAVRTLGEFYSHRVRIRERHRIVDSGPYRFIRHPAYAGMIVANLGVSLYFFNWATVSVFVFVLIPAIALRIAMEEKTLFEVEGYPEFAEKRKRLFPAIW